MDEIDPKVQEILKRLKEADRKINKKLFALIGLCILGGFYFDSLGIENGFLIFFILTLLGGMLYLIISTVKAKKAIGKEFGIICPKCGQVPKQLF